jgi:glycosyltransferase involved in cell wall biosynthesis
VPEIVDDGITGMLVPRSVETLSNAQLALLRSPELARRLGEAGRVHVEQELSLEKMVSRTLIVYRRALGA